MAFHRVTPYLRPAVRGVLNQTVSDLELLLTDNGTGQGLGPLGDEGRDPRIRLISHSTNLGIAGAHNEAIARARGEFIALSDYDDVSLPRRLERQVAALRADPELALASCAAETIDDEGRVIGREFALTRAKDQGVFTTYTVPAPSPSYTGRREVFQRFPFRREFPVAGDFDFLARVADRGKLAGVPEVLFQYRQHGAQATRQQFASQMLSACIIRLITARRRSGQLEELDSVMQDMGPWLAKPPELSDIYRYFAERCVQEGFPGLAVYHARKMLSQSRRVPVWSGAFRVLRQAVAIAPDDTITLLRLFFTGPLRTHGLKRA